MRIAPVLVAPVFWQYSSRIVISSPESRIFKRVVIAMCAANAVQF